ncbi:MAG: nuclear transport factor 2 family protein [Chloroflexi bacterium]|nr:nuclear transport factor 2 family protein [Chloroflexota bacterium]
MTSQTNPAEAEVEQAARAWMEAAGRRDADALDRVLAAEFTMVTNQGSQIDRVQWLENMLHRVGPEFLDVRVHVYGDAALMTRTGQKGGHPAPAQTAPRRRQREDRPPRPAGRYPPGRRSGSRYRPSKHLARRLVGRFAMALGTGP